MWNNTISHTFFYYSPLTEYIFLYREFPRMQLKIEQHAWKSNRAWFIKRIRFINKVIVDFAFHSNSQGRLCFIHFDHFDRFSRSFSFSMIGFFGKINHCVNAHLCMCIWSMRSWEIDIDTFWKGTKSYETWNAVIKTIICPYIQYPICVRCTVRVWFNYLKRL